MKRRILFFIFFASLIHGLQAQGTGIRQPERLTRYEITERAGDYTPARQRTAHTLQRSAAADFILLDQVSVDAYIAPGQRWAVSYDPGCASLRLHPSAAQAALSDTALAAVNRAPRWLQRDLTWTLSMLDATFQTLWARAILDARDPYIDEIAFSIAHASPQYLMSGYGSPALFLENARAIYANDEYLDYVRIIDYGSSASDPDYYSTTRYQSLHGGVVTEVEAPREVYYWYLVYPRATSEIPAYVDPAIVEDHGLRNNNIATPPAGVFWRDWLFNHADAGYPVLRDALKGCTILFDGTRGIPDAHLSALGRLNTWMSQTLVFDSREERPHQPVRIYRVHMGRCGEWSDLRNAAARSALIPCTSVASYSTDHVWNEFWDRSWYHWDNETNYPLMYILSWGKVFGSVFEIRSDGHLTPVTPRYARGICYIDLTIQDANGKPVDGAEVNLYTKDLQTADLWWDMYAITNDRGACTFIVGKDRGYYATVSSAIGEHPAQSGGVVEIIARAISGQDYRKVIKMTTAGPAPPWSAAPHPAVDAGACYLEVDFTAPAQLRRGAVRFDDVRLGAQLFAKEEDGSIDFYFADSVNFHAAENKSPFTAVGLLPDSSRGHSGLHIPAARRWYAVFGNEQNSRNVEEVAATVRLFGRSTAPLRQTLSCTANWNWIALQVAPADPAVAGVLAPLGDNGLRLRSSDQEARHDAGAGWSGSLATLEAGRGYLLQLAREAIFTLAAPSVAVDEPLALEKGWNWIAFLPRIRLSVQEALAPIASRVYQIKGQKHSAMYLQGRWIGDLQQLEPGHMYKINLTEAATLAWPNPQPALGKAAPAGGDDEILPGTPANMVLIARLGSAHAFDRALMVDEQNRCRGIGVLIPGTDLHYFTVVGETEREPLFCELRDSATGWTTRCQPAIHFADHATLGTLTRPVTLSDTDLVYALTQNHPNPFHQGTTMAYTLEDAGEASLTIYNRIGQRVRVLFEGLQPAGGGVAFWDGSDGNGRKAAAGLYIAVLRAGNVKKSRKMVLLR